MLTFWRKKIIWGICLEKIFISHKLLGSVYWPLYAMYVRIIYFYAFNNRILCYLYHYIINFLIILQKGHTILSYRRDATYGWQYFWQGRWHFSHQTIDNFTLGNPVLNFLNIIILFRNLLHNLQSTIN